MTGFPGYTGVGVGGSSQQFSSMYGGGGGSPTGNPGGYTQNTTDTPKSPYNPWQPSEIYPYH